MKSRFRPRNALEAVDSAMARPPSMAGPEMDALLASPSESADRTARRRAFVAADWATTPTDAYTGSLSDAMRQFAPGPPAPPPVDPVAADLDARLRRLESNDPLADIDSGVDLPPPTPAPAPQRGSLADLYDRVGNQRDPAVDAAQGPPRLRNRSPTTHRESNRAWDARTRPFLEAFRAKHAARDIPEDSRTKKPNQVRVRFDDPTKRTPYGQRSASGR